MITAFTAAFASITKDNQSAFSKHHRVNKAGNPNPFAADDRIVCSEKASYSVSVTDYAGGVNVVVAPQNISFVVKHVASGA